MSSVVLLGFAFGDLSKKPKFGIRKETWTTPILNVDYFN